MAKTFLSARWENLIMANYAINPEVLQPYLPKGVELDYYHDKAYVSLVGFMFKNTSLFKMPIPYLGTFEEVNLRFYVKRNIGDAVHRGVVFINETVPFKLVAWLANKLYKEHYVTVPTKSELIMGNEEQQVTYGWKTKTQWNHLKAHATTQSEAMQAGSVEEFIFEHYYGYTKIDEQRTQEYRVNHPRWKINKVLDYDIQCDFKTMYGRDFSLLGDAQPDSVIMAAGSSVSVDWDRDEF